MCLHIKYDEKKIATEDIVCFKWVTYNPDFIPYKGKSFVGIINGIECEGKIQIEDEITFFCTNNLKLDGNRGNDILGYKYSWRFDYNVQSIIIDGVDVMIPTEDSIFTTPYMQAKVKLGETYTSDLIQEVNEYDDLVINIGLHSFVDKINTITRGIMIKCIIPKGAKYYVGEFERSRSYASTQLTYLEIIS